MAVSTGKITLGFLITALFGFSVMQAQEAKPLPRHPGDTIKFEVKFDGPNADRIKTVDATLSIKEAIPKDQAGFRGNIGASAGSPSSDTFRVRASVNHRQRIALRFG